MRDDERLLFSRATGRWSLQCVTLAECFEDTVEGEMELQSQILEDFGIFPSSLHVILLLGVG
jgi:hypothetical protein